MLKRFLEFDITVLDLSSIVALAKTADLFSELFKVMCPLHHFELLARIHLVLLLFGIDGLLIVIVNSHGSNLRINSLANFLEVIQEGCEIGLFT